MNRLLEDDDEVTECVPRACGDEPRVLANAGYGDARSPRMRG